MNNEEREFGGDHLEDEAPPEIPTLEDESVSDRPAVLGVRFYGSAPGELDASDVAGDRRLHPPPKPKGRGASVADDKPAPRRRAPTIPDASPLETRDLEVSKTIPGGFATGEPKVASARKGPGMPDTAFPSDEPPSLVAMRIISVGPAVPDEPIAKDLDPPQRKLPPPAKHPFQASSLGASRAQPPAHVGPVLDGAAADGDDLPPEVPGFEGQGPPKLFFDEEVEEVEEVESLSAPVLVPPPPSAAGRAVAVLQGKPETSALRAAVKGGPLRATLKAERVPSVKPAPLGKPEASPSKLEGPKSDAPPRPEAARVEPAPKPEAARAEPAPKPEAARVEPAPKPQLAKLDALEREPSQPEAKRPDPEGSLPGEAPGPGGPPNSESRSTAEASGPIIPDLDWDTEPSTPPAEPVGLREAMKSEPAPKLRPTVPRPAAAARSGPPPVPAAFRSEAALAAIKGDSVPPRPANKADSLPPVPPVARADSAPPVKRDGKSDSGGPSTAAQPATGIAASGDPPSEVVTPHPSELKSDPGLPPATMRSEPSRVDVVPRPAKRRSDPVPRPAQRRNDPIPADSLPPPPPSAARAPQPSAPEPSSVEEITPEELTDTFLDDVGFERISAPLIEAIEAEPAVAERRPPPPPRRPPPLAPSSRSEEEERRTARRLWWEDAFRDDFVRADAPLQDRQIKREVDFIEEALGVAAGGVILDLCCGTGHHAVELSSRGYGVVGYDLSLYQLALAAEVAQEKNQKLNFLQGDVREMAFEEMFDGIYCWNTSFGYFEEEKNFLVAERIYRALRSGGMLLLDVINRDFVVQQTPNSVWYEGDCAICMDEMSVDFITSRLRVKRQLMLDDGRQKEIHFSIRLYSLHELGKLLHDVGFRVTEASGHPSTPGVFFGAQSPRIIIVAQKP